MIKTVSRVVAAMMVAATTVSVVQSDGPQENSAKTDNKLVGTWKLNLSKYGGQEFKFPEGTKMLKHVTPSQFMWVTYDPNGQITRAAGGPYSLKAEVYEETPEYGIGSDFDLLKGKAQTFKWRVDGNKWYHNGKLSDGETIEEVWERVENK